MRPLFRRKRSDNTLFVTACMFGFITVLIALAVNYMGSTPSSVIANGKVTHVATHQSVTRDSQSDTVAFAYASQNVGTTANANATGNSLTQLIPQVRKALGNSAAALTQTLTGLPDHETVSINSGETLNGILAAFEVPQDMALSAIESMKDVFSPRSLRAGQKITLMFRPTEEGSREFTGYRFSPDPLRDIIVLDEKGTGEFSSKVIEKDLRKVIVAKQGHIVGSLSGATARAGVPQSVLSQMIKAYSYSIDFQRDIKEGDKFEVLYQAEIDDKGRAYRTGEMLFARLTLRDKEDTVYLYKTANGTSEYFKEDGKSVRRSLLKTPIDGVRVTSGFGMRRHPILGYSKRHNGIDFGARTGTPIFAAGDGIVVRSSWFSSYGNYVKIRHNNGIETAYAHMSRYAKGLRTGSKVKQGQIIGYVGTTGRSTGAHLHYEVHMHGRPVNPLGIKVPMGTQLAGKDLHKFKLQVGSVQSQLKMALRQGPINTASR
jgi:murein DD-endopeptidase MepM/ murein hydrolase activator NlpD